MHINPSKTLKVGITGGIGTGKTTVCKYFEKLNIPIYYSDDRAKILMNEDKRIKAALQKEFGEEVYTENGILNRPFLAQIVFNNEMKLKILNSIVHPLVEEDYLQWHENLAKQNIPYTIKESAILFESGLDKHVDKTIVVTAPLSARIERVMARDNSTKEAILARIHKQMPQAEKDKLADFLIENIDQNSLAKQVAIIDKDLRQIAQNQ